MSSDEMKSSATTVRQLCLLLASLLLSLNMTACASNTNNNENQLFSNYTEIPYVTREDIDAIESIRAENPTLLYGMCPSSEAFYNEQGEIEGYSVLFCELLTDLFDIEFKPVVLEWDELYKQLVNGTISFTGDLTSNQERLQTFHMTSAIAERSIKTFRLAGAADLLGIASARNPKFAFLRGTNTDSLVKTVCEYEFETYYVDNYSEAVISLRNGVIDAFLTDGPAEEAFNIYPDITAQDFFPLIYTPVSLATLDPKLDPIISVVQKYLSGGAIKQLTQLYNKGYRDYLRHKLFSSLTDDEKKYIYDHIDNNLAISVVMEFDIYPTIFFNTRDIQWQGIAKDVLDEIALLTGLKFKTINTPSTDWYTLLDMLESGQAAMTTELMYSQEREGRFLWADSPYSVDYYALLSKEEHADISVNMILYSTVGLIYESGYADVFNSWFPDHPHTVVYKNMDDAFKGLDKGDVDFLMTAKNILQRATNYMEQSGYKTNLVFDRTYGSSFGFNKDQEVLRSIISKAQKLVEIDRITNRWTSKVYDYNTKLVQSRIPLLVSLLSVICVAFILAMMLFFMGRRSNLTLENTVRERTAQLQQQTKAALSSAKAKSAFLANMSHEIRTPLNAIIGMAEITKLKSADDAVIQSIDEILDASKHLQGLINDVLDFSKIESGKLELVFEAFDLKTTIHEIVSLINQRCIEKDILFMTPEITLSDTFLYGDKLRLKQILINLLGNAVKFTNSGGNIKFEIVVVNQCDDTVTLLFSVCDNGIGISEEQIPNLFAAFEQGDSAISVQYEGTGLGLSISQSLVHAMGSEISVKSVMGEGSIFSFEIEFNFAVVDECSIDENINGISELEFYKNLDLSGMHILLAEDIEINRVILIELLSDTGVEIQTAENGQQALEMFEKSTQYYYDLIIMDIQMPSMDGYQSTNAIRVLDRPDAVTVPIYAMTANAYREDVEKALAVGMNGHLAKPIDILAIRKLLYSIFYGAVQ